MSFDPTWLDLREPADHTARSKDLLQSFCAKVPQSAHILDLGSGTGSTLRAVAPLLPDASWTLTDHDPSLLAIAKERAPEAEVMRVDLATNLDEALSRDADAITASALIDLVSAEWLDALANRAAGRVIYIALSYDGREEWNPSHEFDRSVFDAFQLHQTRDKGFGPALGAAAVPRLKSALEDVGYTVLTAHSPWKLRPGALMRALSEGIANAAKEAGVASETAKTWSAARANATACCVGHLDLLAYK